MRSSPKGERKVLDDPKLKARFFFVYEQHRESEGKVLDEGKIANVLGKN